MEDVPDGTVHRLRVQPEQRGQSRHRQRRDLLVTPIAMFDRRVRDVWNLQPDDSAEVFRKSG